MVWFLLPPITPPQKGAHAPGGRPANHGDDLELQHVGERTGPGPRRTPARPSSRIPTPREAAEEFACDDAGARPGVLSRHPRRSTAHDARRAAGGSSGRRPRHAPGPRPVARRASRPRRSSTSTLELLAEVGPTALSVEEVASRAGVGKATIYRRFPTKDDLVVAALASLNESLPTDVREGATRDVLVAHGRRAGGRSTPDGQQRPAVPARAGPREEQPADVLLVLRPGDRAAPRRLPRASSARGSRAASCAPTPTSSCITTLIIASSVYTLQMRASGRDAAPGDGPEDLRRRRAPRLPAGLTGRPAGVLAAYRAVRAGSLGTHRLYKDARLCRARHLALGCPSCRCPV